MDKVESKPALIQCLYDVVINKSVSSQMKYIHFNPLTAKHDNSRFNPFY